MALDESDKEDLRTYLTECIVALRWLKDRQLAFTTAAVAVQLALYNADIRAGLGGLYGVAVVSLLTLVLFIIALVSTIASSLQARAREKLILEHLSSHLWQIISSTTGSGQYGNADWKRFVDWFFYLAHTAPVVALTFIHSSILVDYVYYCCLSCCPIWCF